MSVNEFILLTYTLLMGVATWKLVVKKSMKADGQPLAATYAILHFVFLIGITPLGYGVGAMAAAWIAMCTSLYLIASAFAILMVQRNTERATIS